LITHYQLTLDYQLHPGWLEPYIRGLQQGAALGKSCSACKIISFPPIHVCECGHTNGEWVSLSGKAHIVNRCTGTEGDFALVQFDGADTKTVVRLENISDADFVGYLKLTQPNQNHSDKDHSKQADVEQNHSDQTLGKSALVLTSHKHEGHP